MNLVSKPSILFDKKIKIYSAPLSMFGAKAVIAAHEKNIDFELVMVPYNRSLGYSPKHPEVIRINPKQQVPVLTHGKVEIFDSTQIFEYLEDLKPSPALWPCELAARASARLLEHKSDEVYFTQVIKLMNLQDALESDAAADAISRCLCFYENLDAEMNGEYLQSDFSFADIAFLMAQFFGERMGAKMSVSTPKLYAWRERMHQRNSVRKAILPMLNYLHSVGRPCPEHLRHIYEVGVEAKNKGVVS
jgi:glutathione S-transferase